MTEDETDVTDVTQTETETETREAEPETTEEPAEAEHTGTAETPKRKRFPLSLSLPVTIVLAVVLLAAIAGAVTFGLLYRDKADVDAASAEALNAARGYAVTVTSYDYQNLDKNFADVIDGATGEFKDQYSGASATLRQLIQQAKATARGTVIDAGVKSATADRADVTLFVDQSVTNAATPQPRVDRNRVLMTLEKHDNRWLVSNLQLI